MPPSLLATALVLQAYDGVSDDEAKQRADYDLDQVRRIRDDIDRRVTRLLDSLVATEVHNTRSVPGR